MKTTKSSKVVSTLPNVKNGISLLDYFAAQAMNGILSNPSGIIQLDLAFVSQKEKVVEESYKIAKAMITVSKKNVQ